MPEPNRQSMKTIHLRSWAGFAGAIEKVRNEFGPRRPGYPGQEPSSKQNTILFRGQADSHWKLETTLERTTRSLYTVQQYLIRAERCVNEIESMTGRKWGRILGPDVNEEVEKIQDFMRVHIPHYEYLVYLRHHGFPSPLLDWTISPYIAAYFAFEQNDDTKRCAVFVFIETPEGIKGSQSGETLITTPGHYVTTHPRHFVQKARYTIATRWDRETNTHTFCSHNTEKTAWTRTLIQDVLLKITIPRKDRVIAMKELDDYNINAYTLFQSEDALVRTMGLRAFDLQET